MADLWVVVGFLSFFGTITGLLAVTFLAFTRMDKDVRRARMFIMEKRIQRFLGAFTFAFIALTVLICASTIAFGLPAAIGTGLLVVWLGGMGYGTYELFLIVRPPKGTLLRLVKKSNTGRSVLLERPRSWTGPGGTEMQRSESRRKAALSNFSDEGIEGQLGKILSEFRRKTNGIRGSVIADGNGLTVASDIQSGVSPAGLSAMSTLIAQSGARVFENIQMSGPSFLIMDGDQANVAVVQFAAGDVRLLLLLDPRAQLGVLKLEMKRTAAKIAEALCIAFGTSTGISELFIITKAGILIRHYSDTLRTDLDRDILSGMLAAVQEFVKQTLSTKAGNLDELRYGTYTVHFVRGLHTIAAAVAKDIDAEHVKYAVSDALQDFEDRYAGILPTWNGDVTEFAGVDECFEKVLKT